MERLTYDFEIGGNHCWQVKGADNLECREVCERQGDDGCKTCPIAKAFDRLAAIEDILGDEYDMDRLRELAQADREGRCVVLPCKVGDTVYLLEKNRVLENKVLQVSFNNSGDWVVFTDCKSLLFCKIGETAFITPEAALKAREQDDQNNNML